MTVHADPGEAQRALFLATKLASPRLPPTLVWRERLLRDLDSAVERPITLLSASAGWGKTTLLSAWASKRTHSVAWVSLDALDNDPTRFWTAVIESLRTRLPKVGADALAMLHSPEPPPLSAVLIVLLNEMAKTTEPEPVVLVLDDYHLIDHPAIHEAITYLVEHLPTQLHIVLTTRVDPELPLSRWRVRGLLSELRAAELRFTEAEAALFFAEVLGPKLSEGDVRLLERRTEGWIAGLQLAALAMRQHDDWPGFVGAFTGSHRYLIDYIQEEILHKQPQNVQQFLLHTSVLRRMNAPLCEVVTHTGSVQSSQEMLEWLERNNLFVVPLDDQRQWYRAHDIFREVLLARLHATQPAIVPDLHRRAAQWYASWSDGQPGSEDGGLAREAIAHALAASDFTFAAELIEREAPRLWLRGEAQAVHSWVQLLPDAVVSQHATLALNATLRLLESVHAMVSEAYSRARAQAEEVIGRVERALEGLHVAEGVTSGRADGDRELLRRRIALLRALIASREALLGGEAERMRVLAESTEALTEGDELSWKMVALSIACWRTESLQREGALLIPRLLDAKKEAIEAGDSMSAIRVMRWLAFAYVRAGRAYLAQQECLAALRLIEQTGEYAASTGYLYYFQVGPLYGWNRIDEAAQVLQHVLRIGRAWQQADLIIVANLSLSTIAFARGDLEAADVALQEAEEMVQHEMFVMHGSVVQGARVQYWLETGNIAAASNWANRVVFTEETWDANRKWEFFMLVRVYLEQRRYVEAVEALRRFRPFLDSSNDVASSFYFLAEEVVALYCAERRSEAGAVLSRLLSMAEREGNIRIFIDHDETMKRVLEDALAEGTENKLAIELSPAKRAFVSKTLAAFQEEKVLAQSSKGRQPALSSPPRAQPPALAEPLTRREEEVLRLLVAGASNRDIADELVVSLATVKKHVSNLLGKLGVASRAQAIARYSSITNYELRVTNDNRPASTTDS